MVDSVGGGSGSCEGDSLFLQVHATATFSSVPDSGSLVSAGSNGTGLDAGRLPLVEV